MDEQQNQQQGQQPSDMSLDEAPESCWQMAQQGDTWAQLQLGLWYLHGDGGTQPNHKAAMRWIGKSARGGNAEAQLELGKMLMPNRRKARRWLRRAAQRGNAEAQYHLGTLYYDKGVAKGRKSSLRKALRWAKRAAEGGYADAHLLICDCDLHMRMLP